MADFVLSNSLKFIHYSSNQSPTVQKSISKQRQVAPMSFFSVKPLQSHLASQHLSEVKVFLLQAVDLLTEAVTDFDERGEILHFCL